MNTEKTSTATRRTQAERTDEARTALIEAAITLIADRGLAGVTLSDVGARAGYSRGLAVYHFGSKTGLILAVFDHVRDVGQQAMARFARAESEPASKLLSLFDAIADTAEKAPALYRATTAMLVDGALSRDADVRKRTHDAEIDALNAVSALIGQLTLKPGLETTMVARAMLNAIYGVQMRAFMMGDSLSVREEMASLKALGRTLIV